MTTTVLRTADSWWIHTPGKTNTAAKIDTTATTTGELLADRATIDTARPPRARRCRSTASNSSPPSPPHAG